MREILRVVAGMGFAGPLTLGMLACAVLLAVALIVAASLARPGAGWALRAIAWAEAACLSTGLLLAFALVKDARRRLAAIEHPNGAYPFPTGPGAWVDAFAETESVLAVAGVALVVVAGLVAAAVIAWQVRAGAGALRAAVLFFAALLPGVTALAIVRHARAMAHPPGHCGTQNLAWCIETVSADAAAPLDQARLHLLVVAAIAAVVLAGAAAWGALRGQGAWRRRPWLGAAVVLLSGIAAYRGTRAAAADARLTLRREPGESDCPIPADLARALPPADRCDAWADGLLIQVGADGALLDGVPHTPEAAGKAFAEKRARFLAVLGRTHRLPPLWITVAAPASAPLREVAPYLTAVRDHLGPDVVIAGVRPDKTFSTRTLGALTLGPRCCATPIRLVAEGVPASTFETWGDLAHAAAAAESTLEVALPTAAP